MSVLSEALSGLAAGLTLGRVGERARRWLLAGGAVAAVQMVAFVSIAGDLRAGYEPNRNWISQLSLGPGGWLAAVNFALCGLWIILCGLGIRTTLEHTERAKRAGRLVIWCGVCLVAIAVVPTDPGIGYPPDVPAADTLIGLFHKIVSVGLGIAGIAAATVLGRCLGSWARPVGTAVAGVMAVAFVLGSVLVLLDANGVLPGAPSGFLERVAMFAGLGWIGVVSVVLVLSGSRTTIAQSPSRSQS
jgi:hypothetical membrane protein